MQSNKLLLAGMALSLVALGCDIAKAQNTSSFTIRRPPDGAVVREKVKIQIPLSAIPEGGYVTIYIDGQFRGAMPVPDADREEIQAAAAKTNSQAFFTYLWDTKEPVRAKGNTVATVPPDGAHEIKAMLYGPKPGSTSKGTSLLETSSVKVNVANQLESDNVGELKLNYKFVTGDSRDYKQTGSQIIVAGLSANKGGIDDQETASYNTDLAIGVEDQYPTGNAMIRNKMRRLEVRQQGNLSVFPSEQLPGALYQEIEPNGKVIYQNNNSTSFDQFAQAGIPIAATLQLPALPLSPVKVGDTWTTSDVSLEIPGTPESAQPKVSVNSKLVGIEWEGGYPTAHIHQTYDSSKSGGFKAKEVRFGTTTVLNPSIKLETDIFVAYRSGTLVKVSRSLVVSGKDAGAVNDITSGGGAPGMSGAGMGGPSMSMSSGAGGNGSMPSGGGKRGGGMSMGMMGGSPQGSSQGMYSGGGPSRGKDGNMPGMGMSMGRMGSGAPSGMTGGGIRGSFGGGSTGSGSSQITLKSVVTTELSTQGK